jgi:hypothetical protein
MQLTPNKRYLDSVRQVVLGVERQWAGGVRLQPYLHSG